MLRIVLCLGLLLVPAAVMPACGGGSDGTTSAPASRQYVGTQAPGDLWNWSIGPGTTWSARNETLGFDYAGTWGALPSGFLLLTIGTSTEPGVAMGDKAYALEIPDTVLVVKPGGSGDNAIVAVRRGPCPTGPTLQMNYAELTESSWDPVTDDAYGVATVNIAGVTWTGTNTSYLLGGASTGTGPIPTFTCAAGIATNIADPDDVIVVAPTGVFISDSGPGEGGVMGLPVPAADINLADLIAPGREYRAIQYVDDSVGHDTRVNWARRNAAGTGLDGGEYTDVETNVEDPGTAATITFDSQPMPGVVNGTLTDGGGTTDIVFVINRIAGRYVMFGISVSTAPSADPYNFIAIELP